MPETLEQKAARLERELAAARSRLQLSQQEAESCRSRAVGSERDEVTLAHILHEVAREAGFPQGMPVDALPQHVREVVRRA